MRQQLAIQAARIMTEEGVSDFHAAKRKAAERLGVTNDRHMPKNAEIELALQEYQAIFRQDQQPVYLKRLRETALEMMRLLKAFSPRLVGPVLRGTADRHSVIYIHLFSDCAEELGWSLMEHHIPFNTGERQYRFGTESDIRTQPLYSMLFHETEIEITIFPENGIRHSPKSPLDGKPIQRASIADVEKLLEQN